jgi:hypothetical protein
MTVLLAAAQAAPLTLQLSNSQEDVLVGEPLLLRVAWQATGDAVLPPIAQHGRFISFRVEGPLNGNAREGYEYRETGSTYYEDGEVFRRVRAGDHGVLVMAVVQGDRGDGRRMPLLAAEGRYMVAAVLRIPGERDVRSDAVTITVTPPEPDSEDARMLQMLRRDWTLLDWRRSGIGELLRAFPTSRYLRCPRSAVYHRRASAIAAGLDEERLVYFEGQGQTGAARRQAVSKMMVAEAEAGDWGPFGDEVLFDAMGLAKSGGDEGALARLHQRFMREHGASPLAADVARVAGK